MKSDRARLARFRLLAYRSCKDTQFFPESQVTTLIGPNGAGKTNLMQGILLLSLPSRRRHWRTGDSERYTSKCGIEVDFAVGRKLIHYQASLTYRPNELNRDDVIDTDEKWNFKDIGGKADWIDDESIVIPVREIEAWLLADQHAIKKAMKLKRTLRKIANPESLQNPKEYLANLVYINSEHSRRYVNAIHNPQIAAACMPSKLRRCPSFVLLHQFILKHI